MGVTSDVLRLRRVLGAGHWVLSTGYCVLGLPAASGRLLKGVCVYHGGLR